VDVSGYPKRYVRIIDLLDQIDALEKQLGAEVSAITPTELRDAERLGMARMGCASIRRGSDEVAAAVGRMLRTTLEKG
jgi:hypothetical protein